MLRNVIGKTCVMGLEVGVLSSNAGKYVGTVDEFGCPNCRISAYFGSLKEIENAPLELRKCYENDYCNSGCGCFSSDER